MKKFISLLTVLALCLSCMAVTVFADDAAPHADVYVSIANAGELEVAYEAVSATDLDGDGAITIADALAAAHDAFYEGGATAGFASANTEYGLSLTKLWGVENGGSYGYYVNNTSAWSLADPVADGDYVYAYSYQDLEAWSDAYTYFNVETATGDLDAPMTLTLSKVGFDENWAPVALPVEGAVIYLDGEATSVVTDAQGNAQIQLKTLGQHTVTAKSESEILTPAVCKIDVAAPHADVYVSISNVGQLEVAYEAVSATDLDGDGAITIADALAAAHDAFYEGGAAAGFASANTEYGLSLTKLWGIENGGSYGYYVNNASAWSLADPVADGDYVYAYSYQDLEAWSDAYTYFNVETAVGGLDTAMALTLSKIGFDENWAPVALPVEGAVIYLDGEATSVVTDAQGNAQIQLKTLGQHTITAKSESEILTPAVCKAKAVTFSDTVGLEDLDAIEAVIASGLMTGTDKGFEPQQSINRAQLVTILYRMAGSPEVTSKSVFTDVYAGLWCEKAVVWAYEMGLVQGYGDGNFGYKDVLTVQQILLIASRYANVAGTETDALTGASELLGQSEQNAPVTRGDLAQLLGRAMITK